ncbi:hypothetical protein MP638_001362 [Amoeboaphelidium occidentale]|nr:hypothetical protein MP638_001362 [Amoeboaphelidium occidentale]
MWRSVVLLALGALSVANARGKTELEVKFIGAELSYPVGSVVICPVGEEELTYDKRDQLKIKAAPEGDNDKNQKEYVLDITSAQKVSYADALERKKSRSVDNSASLKSVAPQSAEDDEDDEWEYEDDEDWKTEGNDDSEDEEEDDDEEWNPNEDEEEDDDDEDWNPNDEDEEDWEDDEYEGRTPSMTATKAKLAKESRAAEQSKSREYYEDENRWMDDSEDDDVDDYTRPSRRRLQKRANNNRKKQQKAQCLELMYSLKKAMKTEPELKGEMFLERRRFITNSVSVSVSRPIERNEKEFNQEDEKKEEETEECDQKCQVQLLTTVKKGVASDGLKRKLESIIEELEDGKPNLKKQSPPEKKEQQADKEEEKPTDSDSEPVSAPAPVSPPQSTLRRRPRRPINVGW